MKNKFLIFLVLTGLVYITDRPLKYCANSYFQNVDLPGGYELKTWRRVTNSSRHYPLYDITNSIDTAVNTIGGCDGVDEGSNMIGYAYNEKDIYVLIERCTGYFGMSYIDTIKNKFKKYRHDKFIKSEYYEEFKELEWHSFDTCSSPAYKTLLIINRLLTVILIIWIFRFSLKKIKDIRAKRLERKD